MPALCKNGAGTLYIYRGNLVHTSAPVDWHEILRRYIGGESVTELAKAYPVTRQAISKRVKSANLDNRVRNKIRKARAKRGQSVTQPIAQPVDVTQPIAQPTIGDDRRAALVELVSLGATVSEACKSTGINRSTFYNWHSEQCGFADSIQQAQREFLALNLTSMKNAAERGDWRAADRILQVNPATKARYGQQANTSQTTAMVALRIGRDTATIGIATGNSPDAITNENNDLDGFDGDDDGSVVIDG